MTLGTYSDQMPQLVAVYRLEAKKKRKKKKDCFHLFFSLKRSTCDAFWPKASPKVDRNNFHFQAEMSQNRP